MEWIHPMCLKIGNMEIRPMSMTVDDYVQAVKGAGNLSALMGVVAGYEVFAGDAFDAVNAMTEEDWPAYIKFNRVGRTEGYKGKDLHELMDRFGAILIPEQMMKITQVASLFHAPDGLAIIRLAEEGMLLEVNGRAIVNLPAGKENEHV